MLDFYYKKNEIENDDLFVLASNWRNDRIIDDTFVGMIYDAICFFGFLEYKDLVFDFMTYYEFVNMLDNKLNVLKYAKKLEKRKNNGYVLLNIPFMKCKVIENKKKVEILRNIVLSKFIDNSENIIRGESIIKYNKKIKGKCVVIKDDIDLNNKIDLSGKIIVATMTTPYFIPYLDNVLGIITDTGGILCHASIIAREKNIPTIVGAINATERIKNNQEVIMNLENGIIEI